MAPSAPSVAPDVAQSRRRCAPRVSHRSMHEEPAYRCPPTVDDGWLRDAIAAEAAGQIAHVDSNLREISLLLEGIHCGACVWIIERYLQQRPGVVEVTVNFAMRRARLRWDARIAQLPELLGAIAGIGYRAYPYDPARREARARCQRRALLARMSIAILAMMQVMMFAVPAYISGDDVEREYQTLLNWASLVLTLPIVFYSATPFFVGAWRDLRLRRLGMDVPIALGVGRCVCRKRVGHGRGAWRRLFRLRDDVRSAAAGCPLVRASRATECRRRYRGSSPANCRQPRNVCAGIR